MREATRRGIFCLSQHSDVNQRADGTQSVRPLRAEQRSILVASRQRIAEEHHAREWIVASGAYNGRR
jgi:hypothetical protein